LTVRGRLAFHLSHRLVGFQSRNEVLLSQHRHVFVEELLENALDASPRFTASGFWTFDRPDRPRGTSETLELHDQCAQGGLRLGKASRRVSQFCDVALEPGGVKTTRFAIPSADERSGPLTVGAPASTLVMNAGALVHTLKPLVRDGMLPIGLTRLTSAAVSSRSTPQEPHGFSTPTHLPRDADR
jgi:hypothetical protein